MDSQGLEFLDILLRLRQVLLLALEFLLGTLVGALELAELGLTVGVQLIELVLLLTNAGLQPLALLTWGAWAGSGGGGWV